MCLNDRGILYIATGQDFVEEAVVSARSVRENMPGTPIALITDIDDAPTDFDQIITVDDPDHGFVDQIRYLSLTPFSNTIYLDTDIYLDGDILDVFELLDEFDIAVAQNQNRYGTTDEDVPRSFPEYNTGVVAYRNTTKFDQFLSDWEEAYWTEYDPAETQNQPTFRRTLFQSDLRVATLPREYNLMVRVPAHVIGHVPVFHGRLIDIETPGSGQFVDIPSAIEKVNRSKTHRVITQAGGLKVHSNSDNPISYFMMGIRRYGIRGTLERAIARGLNKIR